MILFILAIKMFFLGATIDFLRFRINAMANKEKSLTRKKLIRMSTALEEKIRKMDELEKSFQAIVKGRIRH